MFPIYREMMQITVAKNIIHPTLDSGRISRSTIEERKKKNDEDFSLPIHRDPKQSLNL